MNTQVDSKVVLDLFTKMNAIPRGSGNEKAISDFIVNFGKERNLEVSQDDQWNVIIRKPASPGFENRPPIILQGHIDMVCEKTPESNHDFTKDPIKCIIDGDWMHADGTTLGADNLMGVAMALAVFDSSTIQHGPLEGLFTTNEETGMDGAAAVKAGSTNGQYLINIDTEVEGEFIVSCAGGCRIEASIPLLRENPHQIFDRAFTVSVDGLLGGHSGMEIYKQRANALQILGRLLRELDKQYDYRLTGFNGGTKHNAIPRQASAIIVVKEDDVKALQNWFKNRNKAYNLEFSPQDPNLQINLNPTDIPDNVYADDTKEALLTFLYLAPNGVYSMSQSLDNLVEASNNIAIVKENTHNINILVSIRSSNVNSLEFLRNKFLDLSNILGISCEVQGSYPAWEYDKGSNLEEQAVALYTKMNGQAPTVTAVHAGLECGLLKGVMPNTQMLSFGPTITGAHTPEEKVFLPSVNRIFAFLVELLKELK